MHSPSPSPIIRQVTRILRSRGYTLTDIIMRSLSCGNLTLADYAMQKRMRLSERTGVSLMYL
jgi:hypothetical protein